MEHHVFAVWDFMSLLKALQQRLTCVSVPWVPSPEGAGEAGKFVNQIVLGEETDDDGLGGSASHFELYYRAMAAFGASTRMVEGLLAAVRKGVPVGEALRNSDVPLSVRSFVEFTFRVIETGDVCRIASAFTYGREDLIPDVFRRIVDQVGEQSAGLEQFRFYLDRHIEVDSGEHGPMAERLMQTLCGNDDVRWHAAEEAAVGALQARIGLWDGILAAVDRQAAVV